MEQRPESVSVARPLYDVLLESGPSELPADAFPVMSIQATGAQTALRHRVSGPEQMDVLLDNVFLLCRPLVDVHRLPGPTGEDQTYEVRVAGEVGEPLLRYLNWSHRVVPGQIRVRIAAAAGELHQFLLACTASGASIQRVRMINPPGAGAQPTPA